MENEITITNSKALSMALALSKFLSEIMTYEGWGNINNYELMLINRVLNPIGWKSDCYGNVTTIRKGE